MVVIGIIITQSGSSGGSGESRQDLVLNELVTLSNVSNEGVTSFKWELIGKPYTSSVNLSSTSSSSVTFTPDVEGSYLIQLIINNKLKQRVVAAVLTDRLNIRIPASGEGEEIHGGSFKAITDSIRIIELEGSDANKINGKNIASLEPGLNDFLRYDGEKWISSGKMRTDDIGFRNSQDIFIKIPLTSATPANDFWKYDPGTSIKPSSWKTVSSGGVKPVLDFSWNAFPHGSILKKVCVIASCSNPLNNEVVVRIDKKGAVWQSNQITSFVNKFISSTQHVVSSTEKAIIDISANEIFMHGNGKDDVVVSDDLNIRITADGINDFNVLAIYVFFQTLAVGLYNGPLEAEGGNGDGQGDGGVGGCCPAPFDWIFEPTTLTAEQNGQYFMCLNMGNDPSVTLPLEPTPGMQFTIYSGSDDVTIFGAGTLFLGPGGLSNPASDIVLSENSLVTITAKSAEPFFVGFIWVITSGIGKITNAAFSNRYFDFNFNLPTFVLESGAELIGRGGVGGNNLVRVGKNVYGVRRSDGGLQLAGGTIRNVGPNEHWYLIESGHNGVTGTTQVECVLSGFADYNDYGWKCEFMCGIDASQDPVPMMVSNSSYEICIEESRFVSSIVCSDVGGYVQLMFKPGLGRGRFVVIGGRGTWTDNLGGIHNLSGGGGGASSLQEAYDGGNEIIIPGGGEPVIITNNRIGSSAVQVKGTGPHRISAIGDLEITDGNYTGIKGPTDAIPLTDGYSRDFIFPCSSLVDSINKAWLGAGAVAWSGETTNDTLKEIFVGGEIDERYIMPTGSSTLFQLTAIARDNTNNRSKAWDIVGLAQVSMFGVPSWVSIASPKYTVIDQTDPSGGTDDWDIELSLNGIDYSMMVRVKGQTGTTIQWSVFRR